ncbi:hypothetical protein C9994_16370, partial [Marivirga lumbricoides]
MKFKKLLFIGPLLLISASSYVQIQVKGRVFNSEGSALPGVTVSLNQEQLVEGAITDRDGQFEIAVDGTGNYQLELRSVGFQTYTRQLSLLEKKVYKLDDIKLQDDKVELQMVEI